MFCCSTQFTKITGFVVAAAASLSIKTLGHDSCELKLREKVKINFQKPYFVYMARYILKKRGIESIIPLLPFKIVRRYCIDKICLEMSMGGKSKITLQRAAEMISDISAKILYN